MTTPQEVQEAMKKAATQFKAIWEATGKQESGMTPSISYAAGGNQPLSSTRVSMSQGGWWNGDHGQLLDVCEKGGKLELPRPGISFYMQEDIPGKDNVGTRKNAWAEINAESGVFAASNQERVIEGGMVESKGRDVMFGAPSPERYSIKERECYTYDQVAVTPNGVARRAKGVTHNIMAMDNIEHNRGKAFGLGMPMVNQITEQIAVIAKMHNLEHLLNPQQAGGGASPSQ